MKAISRGYRTAGPDTIRLTGWTVTAGGLPIDNPTMIPQWTCYHDLHVTASAHVDLTDLAESTGLGSLSSVGLALLWRSVGGTGLRGSALATNIVDGEQSISATIPAGQVAVALSIEVQAVLLAAPGGHESVGTASDPGSILWSSLWGFETRVTLEGEVPRLPVAAVSSATAPFYGRSNALWFIDLDASDLAHSLASSIRVLLNRDSPAIQRLLLGTTVESHAIKHFLLIDQRRQMLLAATESESEFDESASYPPGSVGQAISNVVKLTGKDIDSLRALRAQQPAEFELEIQELVASPTTLEAPVEVD